MTAYYISHDGRYVFHGDHVDQPEHFKRVVVIDPEDREQTVRLGALYFAHLGEREPNVRAQDDAMQAALRSLLAPPRPPEPTGLGAVVEDAAGRRYIRTADTDCRKPWSYANNYSDHEWSDFVASRVLSEGVQP